MKYWVYINDKVEGPYDGEKLVTLEGFTPDTLICSEEDASSGKQAWVKASAVFDFEPTEEEQPESSSDSSSDTSSAIAAVEGTAVNALLEKLSSLTEQMSHLQTKLDTMESNIESRFSKALDEQRSKLESVWATHQVASSVAQATTAAPQASTPNTQAAQPTAQQALVPEETKITEEPSSSEEKTVNEDELVLQSALDSMYSSQLVDETIEKDEKEDTFQDLLTPKQAEQLAQQNEGSDDKEKENQPKKDALLDELMEAPKEDILDQIIQEKQEEQEKKGISPVVGAALGTAAGAGIAALATTTNEEKNDEDDLQIDLSDMHEVPSESLQIAPDKENPEHLEPVLPAEQMPADVPAEELEQPAEQVHSQLPEDMPADVPSFDAPVAAVPSEDNKLPGLSESENLEPGEEENQIEEVDDNENTLQELVPGAVMEAPDQAIVTEQELKEAFTERDPNGQQELVSPFSEDEIPAAPINIPEESQHTQAEVAPVADFSSQVADTPLPQNSNDLTEIELKEGATYLISDFVPPAQVSETPVTTSDSSNNPGENTTEIQDILSGDKKAEETKKSEEAEMNISNVLQQGANSTKRGATFDIKTVPMVQEPGQSDRLQVEGLDDVNAQHDIKPADARGSSNMTKVVMGGLIGLLFIIVLYVLLGFLQLIPSSINILAKEKTESVPAAQMEEILPSQNTQTQENIPADMKTILEEVKESPLANGYTLQAFIEAQNASFSPDLITWDISTTVEPDNYSVLAKVPPENPQSFKKSYRFNYNAVTKALDPTTSDAKNLLDIANSSTLPAGL